MKKYYFIQELFNLYLVKDMQGNVVGQKTSYKDALTLKNSLSHAL